MKEINAKKNRQLSILTVCVRKIPQKINPEFLFYKIVYSIQQQNLLGRFMNARTETNLLLLSRRMKINCFIRTHMASW